MAQTKTRQREGRADQPLAGYRVTVIGPPFREREYSRILEQLGAKVRFVEADNTGTRVAGACARADGILFVTTFAAHMTDSHLNTVAKRQRMPVVRITHKGLERFREAALALVPRMAAYCDARAQARLAG